MKTYPRILTAMVTPFKEDGGIDLGGAQKLASYLIENGSEGIVVAGTTGESPTLSSQEKIELFTAVKEAVGERGWVIAGTGTNSTADSVHMTAAAEKVGVDGIMAVAPYYNKPNQEGLYQHFKAIASATALPVMVYNVPPRTSVNILPETVVRLAKIPNIVAVKEAAGSLDQVSALCSMLPADFHVFSGDDSLTLPILSVGGYGVVSVASHVAGVPMSKMVYAYLAGKIEEATSLHLKLFPFFRAIFVTTNPIPIKKALDIMGLPAGPLRLPLVEATEKEAAVVREAMVKAGLLEK